MADKKTPKGPQVRQSTFAFRLINPELFIKPNKVVMFCGVAALVGCVAYIGYMKSSSQPSLKQTSSNNRQRKSKWD
ncbi:Small integral membrane protein 8 [Exaiptasia diaphana]|nr:Small integral membrane protein 8 [Exaiptasia diaphana]